MGELFPQAAKLPLPSRLFEKMLFGDISRSAHAGRLPSRSPAAIRNIVPCSIVHLRSQPCCLRLPPSNPVREGQGCAEQLSIPSCLVGPRLARHLASFATGPGSRFCAQRGPASNAERRTRVSPVHHRLSY